MSLFRRAGSPYWYSEIQVRGARVVRSTGTSDKREAARFERALRESLKRETAAKPRLAMTLSQAAARFWNEHGKDLRSARSTHWNVNRFMQFFGEDLLLCELSNKHVAELVEARKKDGAAAAGINRTLAALRQVHRMASRRWDEPVKSIDWSTHWRLGARVLRPRHARHLVRLAPLVVLARRFGCPRLAGGEPPARRIRAAGLAFAAPASHVLGMTTDTLEYVKRLEAAGVPRPQAEAHAEALRDTIAPQLATKADLDNGVTALRSDLNGGLSAAKSDLDLAVARLEGRIDALGSRLEAMILRQGIAIILGVLAVGGLLLRFVR